MLFSIMRCVNTKKMILFKEALTLKNWSKAGKITCRNVLNKNYAKNTYVTPLNRETNIKKKYSLYLNGLWYFLTWCILYCRPANGSTVWLLINNPSLMILYPITHPTHFLGHALYYHKYKLIACIQVCVLSWRKRQIKPNLQVWKIIMFL